MAMFGKPQVPDFPTSALVLDLIGHTQGADLQVATIQSDSQQPWRLILRNKFSETDAKLWVTIMIKNSQSSVTFNDWHWQLKVMIS